MHLVLFLIFGAVCIGAAINLLVQKHPINSALSLIVVMGSLALLYLLLGAEFVAAVQIIVYAGAVMVLFVFPTPVAWLYCSVFPALSPGSPSRFG
jgi:NADH-quinone oxidoreductase subunit J